jgi:exodeoxyribonuclease V alpha subunit
LSDTTETVRGAVHRTFFASPTFTAGLLRTDDGQFVRFRGKFCAVEGDTLALVGRWMKDPKYGHQFDAECLSYDLPETHNGLVQYLAAHPAFKGIGPKTAEKIVDYAGSLDVLDRLIREGAAELHERLRIPTPVLQTLREAWIANATENRVRTYLAGFGLTPHQMNVLLDAFGSGVVGVLRQDPYQIIRYVSGYGFKRVDQIARQMGTPKDHPGRIEAALRYALAEEIDSGHTWTAGRDLLDKANDILLLDTLDSLDKVRAAANRLLERGDIMADGTAVTVPVMLEAEQLIHDTLKSHAWSFRPAASNPDLAQDLNEDQLAAYRKSLIAGISVVSGGAGVGKTFLIARLARTFRDAGLSVALCAPTGKAAKRIEEVMRQYGLTLEAKTIHRLLGYDGHTFHRESLSLPCADDDGYDVVIADEVSMVDVPLLADLFRRINFARTRVVLVGDHNQLPPVGPGNVLRDIICGRLAPTTVLTEVVRQAGILKANSTKVLSGVVAPTAVGDTAWTVIDSFRDAVHIQTYLRDLILKLIPERLGYDPVRDVQIVTPTHKGPLGTKALNEMMQALLHGRVEGRFALGDKVIQTSNDYTLGVMNGTIGQVVAIEGGVYHVDFNGEGCHKVDGERLGNVQLAYALTGHKCQGSEFPCVVVVCHKSHFFADRNWLYTAVTRAAKTCIILGDRWGLKHAAAKNNTIKRRTFLSLWAGQGGAPKS